MAKRKNKGIDETTGDEIPVIIGVEIEGEATNLEQAYEHVGMFMHRLKKWVDEYSDEVLTEVKVTANNVNFAEYIGDEED